MKKHTLPTFDLVFWWKTCKNTGFPNFWSESGKNTRLCKGPAFPASQCMDKETLVASCEILQGAYCSFEFILNLCFCVSTMIVFVCVFVIVCVIVFVGDQWLTDCLCNWLLICPSCCYWLSLPPPNPGGESLISAFLHIWSPPDKSTWCQAWKSMQSQHCMLFGSVAHLNQTLVWARQFTVNSINCK